ncbi:glycosyltransferase family 2 protein [Psychroserpens sp. Hel_I_66]|uniref:glycosyltransferase family 2 protein n=1 Tax=Psychroserpens sp. Hel_I_66 TaxID=1250004 RepID=UPI00064701F9|nr:glycosyltransferase family 2 protein [Psychroserpens sp. Hel_I_66]
MNFRKLIPLYTNPANFDYLHKFTVFTPVYNAESTIERVHQSLLNQNFKDFEWLIINDGSKDKSHEVISKIIEHSPLKINYVNNAKNQHKMACFLQAVNFAKGEFLLTFDADDECVPEALEVFNNEYLSIPSSEKSIVSAVTGLCIDQNGNPIGSKFPTNPYFSNTFKSTAIDKITGEKWGFTKTNVLKGIVFEDEFIHNGFMKEGIIWNLLAKEGFKTKYINKTLRIYHLNVENSISSASKRNTALGSVIQNIVNFNWFFNSYFFKSPIFFLKNLYFLLKSATHLDFQLKNYIDAIDSFIVRFFLIILWPFKRFF